MRRDLVLDIGGLDERLGHLCDWFLLHSMALFHGVAYIPEALSVWRQDMKSYSKKLEKSRKCNAKFHMKIFDLLCEKNHTRLRSLFRRPGILRVHIRKSFNKLLWRPSYWDFLVFYALQVIINRGVKYGRMLTRKNKS